MVERARAAQRAAANTNFADDLASAQREVKTRSIVVQDGLEAWPLPGLAPMTRVRTSFGDVHAAALRKGDEVLTRDGSYMRIAWLTRIQLDEHILNLKPDSNPVVLAPGALGAQVPSAEIMLSPRQIVCADGNSGLKRDREAAMLLSRPGVRRLRETALSYTVFHVGRTAEVFCEGLYLRFAMEA
ncbi:MAG: Hint domain-containing protein [Paracoccaceae bacterium]|nr:Hint domain-containing protein [Paracoccaceae bacterium]